MEDLAARGQASMLLRATPRMADAHRSGARPKLQRCFQVGYMSMSTCVGGICLDLDVPCNSQHSCCSPRVGPPSHLVTTQIRCIYSLTAGRTPEGADSY